MTTILVSAELRDLLDSAILRDHAVAWMEPGTATPTGDHEAIIPLLSRQIGETELEGLPNLRIVANCAVGFDNLDLDAIGRRGIIATNTPDVLTNATADLTWTLILAAARRVKEGQHLVEHGWPGWHPTQLLGVELNGATLGIIGAGRIGRAVAKRGVAFGMSVCYADTAPQPDLERETDARHVTLEELLRVSDVVSVHVPLTEETKGLLDADRLAAMKQGSVLVNTARGGIVDEDALLHALENGPLFAAGLDVFDGEPHIRPALVAHPRVVCLPHLGSATAHTRRAMANLAARNVRDVLVGKPPLTPVNR
jgi:glyoxylate reductase